MKYQEKDKIHENSLTKWRFQYVSMEKSHKYHESVNFRLSYHDCFSHLRRCRGTAPEPRYGHAAALVGGRVAWEPSEWALGWGRLAEN